jgi:two-component sensor histidine kinase
LVLDGALGDTTVEQRDFLKTMDGDLERLTELINNMLDISKIEAGRMRLNCVRLDARTLVDSLVRSYQPILGHRAVRSEVTHAPMIFADPHRLRQVLTNLFSNAIKFTQDDGRITFRMDHSDGMARIAVEDDGPGLAPEDLPKLFQKFSQVGPQGSGVPRGTGLGLVVCKELTELHGGRIEVASQVGRGTTFTILLPAYTDTLALSESFRQQLDVTLEEHQAHVLIAIQANACLEPSGKREDRPASLEHLAGEVRQHLHRGDVVLAVDPSWVVIFAITDVMGVRAIANRLQSKLREGQRLQFGVAFYPDDGTEADALFEHASACVTQDAACLQQTKSANMTSLEKGQS